MVARNPPIRPKQPQSGSRVVRLGLWTSINEPGNPSATASPAPAPIARNAGKASAAVCRSSLR